MLRYILRRLAGLIAVLLIMSFVIYSLIGLMPGDPIDLMLAADPEVTSEDVARLKAVYGLDRPLLQRYWVWLGNAAQGDFGYSRLYGQPALEVLGPRLINTLWLMGLSFLLALLIAIPAGVAAAMYQQSWLDHAINLLAFAAFSVPAFWLGLLLILLFAVGLDLLPAGGVEPVGGGTILERTRYLVLPVLTLTLVTAGTFVRFTRSAVIECLREHYIRTARAKGLSQWQTVWRHALRNAMIPVVTIAALHFGSLFSGALVVETIFAYLGMGKLIFDSIMGNDYNLALVALMLATAVTLLANLGADLVYVWLDPRISYRD
ncbi:MAG: ABC transporter permease [Pseudomonadota bacterium]